MPNDLRSEAARRPLYIILYATQFGLADFGFGSPELGSFSLSELASLRLPFGMGIERDILFEAEFPLSVYLEAVRQAGSIVESDRLLKARCSDAAGASVISPHPGQPSASARREEEGCALFQ